MTWRMLCAATVAALGVAAAAEDSFGGAVYLADAAALPGWAAMVERYRAEQPLLASCREDPDSEACSRRLRSIGLVLERGAALTRRQQIDLVNRYVNGRKRYRSDHTRTVDDPDLGRLVQRSAWATPLEFFERGGDCEDYAASKYFLLRELGVPVEDMRIIVALERRERAHHAVLAVRRDEGGAWLLETDNHVLRRKPATYRYVYAVNEHGVWDYLED